MEIRHKVVILTKNSAHHWYFIFELAKVCDIEAIIIDQPVRNSLFSKINKHGLAWTLLKFATKFFGSSVRITEKELEIYCSNFELNSAKKTYGHLVHLVKDINSDESKKLLAEIRPDYLCSLGGGLIDSEGIALAKIGALNLHSGISPFYNGADMVDKVIESRNLNFIGSTLMLLTPQIDAGPILGHHLPRIESIESSHSLFCKTIVGGIKLYSHFLTSKQSLTPKTLNLIHQKIPMHYYLGYDRTIKTEVVKKYFFRRSLTRKFVRDSLTLKYYENPTNFNQLLKLLNVIR